MAADQSGAVYAAFDDIITNTIDVYQSPVSVGM
jgi:hypothetical protein